MKETHYFLHLSLLFSLLLHLSVFYTVIWNSRFPTSLPPKPKVMVPVQVVRRASIAPPEKVAFDTPEPPQAIKPLPLPDRKPPLKRALKAKQIKNVVVRPPSKSAAEKESSKKPLPLSNNPKVKKTPSNTEKIKPVFGVNTDSIAKSKDSGTSVRVGNTLMKEQEEAFTPPEAVRSYAVVPAFELNTLPVPKKKVTPEYPAGLKLKGIEGEVLLSATIDMQGKVVKVTVKRSDNELFSKAAVAAVRQSTFSPGMQNGKPAATTIDIPIKFILDE